MGCTMIKTKLFQMMPKPWFKELKTIEEVREFPDIFPDTPEPGQGRKASCGSDMFFYTKLGKMGFKVLAHGGVLPIHWEVKENIGFWLPKGMPPTEGVTYAGKEFGWTDPKLQGVC